ncbi:MAG: hypothetical protein NDI61_05455 [Bdellovibrionaceae bacterium]|nr:hypothetical protein [Pseudobdellovibrionaceae bacterium]
MTTSAQPLVSVLLARALLVMGIISTATASAHAGEVEERVARAFGEAYAQEQLKHQLAEFLNRNPEVIFSSSAQAGTNALNFVSKTLAVYGLITAETDQQRAWSLTHLVISPEPTTAAILIGLQVADTLLTLQAQAKLAAIYQEIAEIRAQTFRIYAQLQVMEANEQIRILEKFNKSWDEIEIKHKALMAHPIYQLLTKESTVVPQQLTAEQVAEALQHLLALSTELDRLDAAAIAVRLTLRPEWLGLEASFPGACDELNRKFDPLRTQLTTLQSAFIYFFASVNSAKLRRKVQEDLKPHVTRLRIYRQCVSHINSLATMLFWKKEKIEIDEFELVDQCQARFALQGVQR